MSWQAFLSYSRQQYHFAESLALALQAKGVALWFDVQQLEPGSDWKADIDDGLTRSDAVLLLASKAALASPYVEREWRHALERRKIVIVGVIEAVRIPRDLSTMPILDLRGDFMPAVDQLIAVLQHPSPPRPVAAWRTRLSPGVNRMARALLLCDVQRILGALILSLIALSYFANSSLIWLAAEGAPVLINQAMAEWERPYRFTPDYSGVVPWLFVLVVVALLLNLVRVVSRLQTLRFVARRFDYAAIAAQPSLMPGAIVFLWAGLAAGLFDFMRSFFDPRAAAPADIRLIVFTGVGIVLLALLPRISRWMAPRHPDPDIVRFAELGKVPTQWRAHLNGAVAGATYAPQRAIAGGLTMYVHSQPGDEDVLKRIQALIEQMGGQFVADTVPARYDLLILSHRTSLEQVQAAMATGHEGILGVIVSRCNIPAELQQLRNFQLVDFSRRDPESLVAALGLLTASSDADRMRMQSYRDPVNLSRIAPPEGVRTIATGFMALALLCGCVTAMLLLLEAPNRLLYGGLLSGAALLLLASSHAALRGRALLSRPLLIVLLSTPMLIMPFAAVSTAEGFQRTGTMLASGIFPSAVIILTSLLLTGASSMVCLRMSSLLVGWRRAVFGMPALSTVVWASIGWMGAAFALAAVFVSWVMN